MEVRLTLYTDFRKSYTFWLALITHNMRVNTICCVYSHYSYPKDII